MSHSCRLFCYRRCHSAEATLAEEQQARVDQARELGAQVEALARRAQQRSTVTDMAQEKLAEERKLRAQGMGAKNQAQLMRRVELQDIKRRLPLELSVFDRPQQASFLIRNFTPVSLLLSCCPVFLFCSRSRARTVP